MKKSNCFIFEHHLEKTQNESCQTKETSVGVELTLHNGYRITIVDKRKAHFDRELRRIVYPEEDITSKKNNALDNLSVKPIEQLEKEALI